MMSAQGPELVADVLVPPEVASLVPFVDAGLLGPSEVHLTAMFVRAVDGAARGAVDERVALALALAARAPVSGHVAVELTDAHRVLVDRVAATPEDLPWPDPHDWADALRASPLVATEGEATDAPLRPLVWDGRRLYLHRLWSDEVRVAAEFLRRCRQPPSPLGPVGPALAEAFGTDPQEDLQHLAAWRALEGHVGVIVGGPGTGKTRTVARLLAAAMSADAELEPALCAPTGKAAARMTEAVRSAVTELDAGRTGLDPMVGQRLSTLEATTVHRLIGRRRDGSVARDARDPLRNELVVVDETSMVDLTLMAQLLDALRPDARLVLVGDPDQLASVEAGTVLADVVGPTPGRGGSPIDGRVVELVDVHRFGADSGISTLAAAVRRGAVDEALTLLREGRPDVRWVRPGDHDALGTLRDEVVAAAVAVARSGRSGDASTALARARELKVLCATRSGDAGLRAWSDRIGRGVADAVPGLRPGRPWELGRPYMVTRNDPVTGVANGDCGVVVELHGRRVLAIDGGGPSPTPVPVARLDQVEPWWAMTIHKSQGSEFDTVVVSLPEDDSPVLSRELLYTALTRARSQVRILADEEVLRRTIERPARRASGLADRLRERR